MIGLILLEVVIVVGVVGGDQLVGDGPEKLGEELSQLCDALSRVHAEGRTLCRVEVLSRRRSTSRAYQ